MYSILFYSSDSKVYLEGLGSYLMPTSANSNNMDCKICGMACMDYSNLTNHLKNEHAICAVCPECGKYLKSENGYTAHLRMHKGVGVIHCGVCGVATQSKAHLKRHMLTHSTAKLFSCPGCNSTYKHNFNLLRHTKVCQGFKNLYSMDCAPNQ